MSAGRQNEIDLELRLQRKRLRFSPELEARFEADTGAQRSRTLVYAGMIALLIYDLFLFNDAAMRPEVLAEATILRVGVLTPVALVVLVLIWRGVAPALRESLMATMVILAMVCSGLIFLQARSPNNLLDPFSFSLLVLGGNIVFSLRFPYAAFSTVATLVTMAGFLWGYDGMNGELKRFSLLIAGATGIFTLFANYRLEASNRQAYLLLLLERQRAQTAIEDNKTLKVISQTDPLTELANRRQFDDVLLSAWGRAARENETLGLLVIDVDNFKAFNDYYGHLEGDACLKTIAQAMKTELRADLDLLARFGGEEFVALLPGIDEDVAFAAAERLRASVERLEIPHAPDVSVPMVTISIGVTVGRPSQGGSAQRLLQSADAAMYESKRKGRNRTCATT